MEEIAASKIIGTKVMSVVIKQPLAITTKIIVDPASGRVLGFLARKLGTLFNLVYIDIASVVNFFKDAILVKTPEDLWDPKEIIRAQRAIESKNFIVGSKVVSEDGAYLGRCYDYFINLNNGFLWQIVSRRLFTTRLFPRDKIIKILPGKIIVENLEKVPVAKKVSEAVLEKQH